MPPTYDVVMVGAGIVGLATVDELLRRRPSARVAVIDKESGPGRHQSSHNSGVLHAGVYYRPGSLKARLCVSGKARMEAFAEEHGIPYERCGKLVVAVRADELGRLDDLAERGRANGVPGLRMLGPEQLREVEPHAVGLRALHVPGTGIIDFSAVVRVLADRLHGLGADLRFGHELVGLRRDGDQQVLLTSAGELRARHVVTCAGLQSDRLARLNGPSDVRIVPFRGDYYTLEPSARHLVRGLVYPVPDPALPFLGVHFTRRWDGEVWAGPNAVLATAREGYRRTDVRWRDLAEVARFPGTWRLARRYWRTGAQEVWRDVVKRAFVRELQRYVPAVRPEQLVFGPSGVRAQAVRADGAMVDDFELARGPGALHVVNAPSPAATAALAIAEHLADEADRWLGP